MHDFMKEPNDTAKDVVLDDPVTVDEEDFRITNNFPVRQQLSLLAVILFLLLGTAYAPTLVAQLSHSAGAPEENSLPIVEPITDPEPIIKRLKLEEVEVRGKAAYVWDVNEQRALYSKNADEVLPLASISKLMTALVAYELIDADTTVTVPLEAIRQEGVSGFVDGEQFSYQSLSDLTLISSSNDGAYALAAAAGALLIDEERQQPSAFIEAMNIKAEEMGLTNTTFFNPTGLDVSTTQSGSYSTARETTFLMEYILRHYPEVLAATQQSHSLIYNQAGAYHDAENTNVIIDEIPNLIGSKTGYTDLAGGNLVVAFDAGLNRPIIVTVLGSSRSGRFSDVKNLVEAVRASTISENE